MQDFEKINCVINKKDQEISCLKMTKKEAVEAPCNEGTSSKHPQSKIEEKTKRKILQSPN